MDLPRSAKGTGTDLAILYNLREEGRMKGLIGMLGFRRGLFRKHMAFFLKAVTILPAYKNMSSPVYSSAGSSCRFSRCFIVALGTGHSRKGVIPEEDAYCLTVQFGP